MPLTEEYQPGSTTEEHEPALGGAWAKGQAESPAPRVAADGASRAKVPAMPSAVAAALAADAAAAGTLPAAARPGPRPGAAADGAARPRDPTRGRVLTVTLKRQSGGSHGMLTDSSDAVTLDVASLDEGPGQTAVGDYNASAEAALRLRDGDVILSVNGIHGHARKMQAELDMKDQVVCKVCRMTEFEIRVVKKHSFGIDIGHAGASLVILKMSDGAFTAWNEENPDKKVRDLDRILEINGQRVGPAQLMSLLRAVSGEARLVIGGLAVMPAGAAK